MIEEIFPNLLKEGCNERIAVVIDKLILKLIKKLLRVLKKASFNKQIVFRVIFNKKMLIKI